MRRSAVLAVYGDQIAFSLGNYVLLFAALRLGDGATSTQIAVALAVYAVCSSVAQGLVADPVVLHRAGRVLPGTVVRAVLLVGAVSAAAMGAVTVLTAVEPVQGVVAALSVGVGTGQFVVRSLLLVRAPATAAGLDLVWLVLQVAGVLALVVADDPQTWAHGLLPTWSVPCLVVLVLGLRALAVLDRSDTRPAAPFGVRGILTRGRVFAVEAGASQGNGQLPTLFLSGSVSDASAVYRGAQALFGPTVLIIAGLRPLLMRAEVRGPIASGRFVVAGSAGMAVMVAIGLVYHFLVPDSLGRLVAGDAWTGIRAIVLLLAVDVGQAVFGAFFYIARRSRGESVLATRLVSIGITALTLLLVTLLVPGSPTAYDFALGVALSAPVQIVLWLVSTHVADRRHLALSGVASDGVPGPIHADVPTGGPVSGLPVTDASTPPQEDR